jgi:SAM-dependent methyltransferase
VPPDAASVDPTDSGHVFRDRARAESFGSIADQYDDARPPYPDELIHELASLGGHDVLDIGCGTGKATVLLAAQGLNVLGVEVDAGMAAVARAHGLDIEVGSFESWDDAGRRFDVITCAQAWHWVEPESGARKAFALLRPGGTLALFWNVHWVDKPVRDRFDPIYAACAPQIVQSAAARSRPDRGSVYTPSLLAGGFADVRTRNIPWETSYTRDEWLALLGTYSDHHLLPDDQLTPLLEQIGAVVDDLGGSLPVHYETHVVYAHRPA